MAVCCCTGACWRGGGCGAKRGPYSIPTTPDPDYVWIPVEQTHEQLFKRWTDDVKKAVNGE